MSLVSSQITSYTPFRSSIELIRKFTSPLSISEALHLSEAECTENIKVLDIDFKRFISKPRQALMSHFEEGKKNSQQKGPTSDRHTHAIQAWNKKTWLISAVSAILVGGVTYYLSERSIKIGSLAGGVIFGTLAWLFSPPSSKSPASSRPPEIEQNLDALKLEARAIQIWAEEQIKIMNEKLEDHRKIMKDWGATEAQENNAQNTLTEQHQLIRAKAYLVQFHLHHYA